MRIGMLVAKRFHPSTDMHVDMRVDMRTQRKPHVDTSNTLHTGVLWLIDAVRLLAIPERSNTPER